MRYGVHAMEMLINTLLKMGAERRNLENFLYHMTVTDARPCVLVRAHRESYCTPDPRDDRAKAIEGWSVSFLMKSKALGRSPNVLSRRSPPCISRV